MDISLHIKNKTVEGRVNLPASKSISNRALIIRALADSSLPIENLAVCDDTDCLLRTLNAEGNRFHIGHAGTAMRFLTAFLSRMPGKWELTGSERMKQRPIGILVEALNHLGARIECSEKPGFPPLRIYGSRLSGGELDIPASVSSQYVSALMMVAPYMEKGLQLRLTGKIVSNAYIDMTAGLMRIFGAAVCREKNLIRIAPKAYLPITYRVEADWSAASYFFEWLAIAEEGRINMGGLPDHSLQGDARQVSVWEKLGVKAVHTGEEWVLTKQQPAVERLEHNFIAMPDLVQSFAVACCMKGIPFRFKGIETLRIKETDRIQALTDELAKLGCMLTSSADSLCWNGEKSSAAPHPRIATRNDHRMALAFAPAVLKFPGLTIENAEVVSKSFPNYWEELPNCKKDIIISRQNQSTITDHQQ